MTEKGTSGIEKLRSFADDAAETWNTRWERTCKPIRKGTSVSCDVCGSELHDPFRFCSGCGAKVVDGNG